MAQITLTVARSHLVGATKADASAFTTTEQDEALQAAFSQFIRDSNCDTELTDLSLAADAQLVDVVSSIANWHPTQFMWGHITATPRRRIVVKPYRQLIEETGGEDKTAEPEFVSFPSNTQAYFYPKLKVARTYRIQRRLPMVAWTAGTADPASTTINIPEEWVYQVSHAGGLYYLVKGLGMYPEAMGFYEQFLKLINDAKDAFPGSEGGDSDRHDQTGHA